MTYLGKFHSQSPGQAELVSSKKMLLCGEWGSSQHGNGASLCPLHVREAVEISGNPHNVFISSSKGYQKALGFISLYQKNPYSDYEVFCLCFFKKNRNKKGFGSATLSKIVLLWGFRLLGFFFLWMACKFCANSDVLFQIISCY